MKKNQPAKAIENDDVETVTGEVIGSEQATLSVSDEKNASALLLQSLTT